MRNGLLAAALLTGLSFGGHAEETVGTDVSQVREALAYGTFKYDQHQIVEADKTLKTVLGNPSFNKLSPDEQHQALLLAASTSISLHDGKTAADLLSRSTAMPQANADDWRLQFFTARSEHDYAKAESSLIRVAQKWPDALHQFPEISIESFVGNIHFSPYEPDAELNLLDALEKANWTAADGTKPSLYLKQLAILWLNKGNQNRAFEVAKEVRRPHDIISIISDNRFKPLTTKNIDQFSVTQAINEEFDKNKKAIAQHPRDLKSITRLANALLIAGKDNEALQILNATLSDIDGTPKNTIPAYDNIPENYPWLLDMKSRALRTLGQWNEAVAVQVLASQQPEFGHQNISQTINLADLYCDMSKPDEAEKVLAHVGKGNAYGEMQSMDAKYRIALETGDHALAADTLSRMKEHQADALHTYVYALVIGHHENEASALMISRLEDPLKRNEALTELQHYLPGALTRQSAEWDKAWQAFKARPEIVDAALKYGSIDSYPVREHPY